RPEVVRGGLPVGVPFRDDHGIPAPGMSQERPDGSHAGAAEQSEPAGVLPGRGALRPQVGHHRPRIATRQPLLFGHRVTPWQSPTPPPRGGHEKHERSSKTCPSEAGKGLSSPPSKKPNWRGRGSEPSGPS